MEQRWDFFKQGETTWGEFYPTHYILAGYESDADAQAAEEAFRASGVAAEDVRAATGQFVAGYLELVDGVVGAEAAFVLRVTFAESGVRAS